VLDLCFEVVVDVEMSVVVEVASSDMASHIFIALCSRQRGRDSIG
jgi:hypothetical protein